VRANDAGNVVGYIDLLLQIIVLAAREESKSMGIKVGKEFKGRVRRRRKRRRLTLRVGLL
jgi:hypothetical protein